MAPTHPIGASSPRSRCRGPALVFGEEIEPEQAFAVGDTPLDVTGAHAAGIKCVGVGSHHYDVDQLREAGADYAIASLEEGLPPLKTVPAGG